VTAYRHRERVPLAVTIGAGFGCAVCVAVAVAVTVTVGFTLSAVGFASVPLFWPSAPAALFRWRISATRES
jgi:hypothetical protein